MSLTVQHYQFDFVPNQIVETNNHDGTYNLELITAITVDTVFTLRLFPGFVLPIKESMGKRCSYYLGHFKEYLLPKKKANIHWRGAYDANYPFDYSNLYLNFN